VPDERLLNTEFPLETDQGPDFYRDISTHTGAFNPSAYFVVIQDYAIQSSGNLSYCGLIEQFAVESLPVLLPFGFALTFFSAEESVEFSLKFSAAKDPDKPIFKHAIKSTHPGWRHAVLEVLDCVVVAAGPHYFEAYLDGKMFQRYPVSIIGLSSK